MGRGTEGEGKAQSQPQNIFTHPALWRGSELAKSALPGIATGFAQLDSELPGHGWPIGALTEILPSHEGIGELRFLGPALATVSQSSKTDPGKHIVWVAPPYLPYAPALAAAGIDLAKILIVKTRTAQESLWAAEQALRANACSAVLVWPRSNNGDGARQSGANEYVALRRLQIAAEGGGSLCFVFRPPETARESSPAPLRLAVSAHAGGLAVDILKRRGGPLTRPVLLPALLPAVRRRAQSETESRSIASQSVFASSESPHEQRRNPSPAMDRHTSAAPGAGRVPARRAHA
jgi:hypothetical protein